MEYTISQWILFFYIYCFLGWCWECCYVSVKEKHWVNRGFLKGPFLPIYGTGAIGVLLVTLPIRENRFLMAIVGMLFAAVLEYVTGAVMERLFRVRYWDYTGCFLNLNGYICFSSVACWGVMTLLVTDVLQVLLEKAVFLIPRKAASILVCCITPVLAADFLTSFRAAMNLRDLLIRNEKWKQEIEKLSEKYKELEQALKETGGRAKEQVMLAGAYAKEQAATAGAYAKEQMMTAGMYAKEQMASAGAYAREQVAAVSERAKEQVVMASGQAKEKVAIASGHAKEQIAAVSERAKEQVTAVSERAREQVLAVSDLAREQMANIGPKAELEELKNRMQELTERMHQPYGKAIRGLLRRNPTASSRYYKETFAELKEILSEKITGRKKEEDSEKKEDSKEKEDSGKNGKRKKNGGKSE